MLNTCSAGIQSHHFQSVWWIHHLAESIQCCSFQSLSR